MLPEQEGTDQQNDDDGVLGIDLERRQPLPFDKHVGKRATENPHRRRQGDGAQNRMQMPDAHGAPQKPAGPEQGDRLDGARRNPQLGRNVGILRRHQLHAAVGQRVNQVQSPAPANDHRHINREVVAGEAPRGGGHHHGGQGNDDGNEFGNRVEQQEMRLGRPHAQGRDDERRHEEVPQRGRRRPHRLRRQNFQVFDVLVVHKVFQSTIHGQAGPLHGLILISKLSIFDIIDKSGVAIHR